MIYTVKKRADMSREELVAVNTLHKRIRRTRGSARFLACVSCHEQALDWAWVHGKDPENIMNYKPMCRSCHKKYDFDLKAAAAMRTPEARAKISEANRRRVITPEWREHMSHVNKKNWEVRNGTGN